MLITDEIANLNYLFIILLMNIIGFLYFYFSPARQAMELRPSVTCFMVMFALIAFAFLIFAARVFIPEALSLTFANALFLLSAYYAKSGFMYRSGKTPPPLRGYYFVWANIALLTIINRGVFFIGWTTLQFERPLHTVISR